VSVEELKSDYETITQQLKEMKPELTTAPELVAFLQNNLVPFMGNMVAEIGELDESVRDVYEGAEDILQPETGALFAAAIGGAMGIVGKLKARLNKANIEDAKILKAIDEWEKVATEAAETIEEITIPDDLEDDGKADDEGDEEEEDEDDDDEGDDESEEK
jgi:hypothetical protein